MTFTTPSAPPAGGRYVLGPLLGSGAVADVFSADDLFTGEAVAVKLLRPCDDDGVRRFLRETEALRRLEHPAIVRLRDAGEVDGRPFMVLDRVDGAPLSTILGREGAMDEVQVARLGAVLASALDHAHAFGIVHRDVKPANVIVDESGGAHLADFGVARLQGSATVTGTGDVVGTAAYLAPEQVRGEPAGPAADVYALGLVLLEALSGAKSYPGSPMEAAVARLHRSPAMPAGVSPWLRELLSTMTAADPLARPAASVAARSLTDATSAALAPTTTLRALVTDPTDVLPVAALAASVLEASGEKRRRRAAWTAILVVLAAVLLGVASATGGLRPGDGASADVPASTVPLTTLAPVTTAPATTVTAPLPPAPTGDDDERGGGRRGGDRGKGDD